MTVCRQWVRKPVISVLGADAASHGRLGRNSPPFSAVFAGVSIERRRSSQAATGTPDRRRSRSALGPTCQILLTLPLPAMEK